MEAVRFALVGYGAWGSHHARAMASLGEIQLAAIVDRDAESRQKAQADFPQVRVLADWREMLAAVDVDAVDVVLPTHLHHAAGMDVLRAGKHLLMEKPLASNTAQCDDLVREARRRGKLLAVGHEFRLSALWGKVKELLDAGAIGDPLYALIELWRNPYRLGSDGWRYDIHRVGNWILEEPIHFFDLARWYFAAAGDPVAVYARANGIRPERPELQDNFSAVLQFAGGRYALVSQTLAGWEHHQVVKITGTAGALWAGWSGAMDRTAHPQFWLKVFRRVESRGSRVESRGSRVARRESRVGSGKLPPLDPPLSTLNSLLSTLNSPLSTPPGCVEEVPITSPSGEVYELVDELAAVARSIRQGCALPCSGEDGRWSVAMCLKAQESVDTGRVVPLERMEGER